MKEDAEPPRYEVTGISLRLRHSESRDLGDILRRWGHRVGREWRAGELRVTPKGNPLDGVWKDSYAYADLALPEADSLSAALALVLDGLEPVGAELQAFAGNGGRAELYVHWHFNANSGDTINWQLSKRLSDVRLDVALDIYPERDWLEGVIDEAPATREGNGKGRSNGEA